MTFTAVFRNGVIEPKQPLELAEGCELDIEIVAKREMANGEDAPKRRKWGLGFVAYVADDFDATPPEFEEYM
jgi:Protein of unknown function DUF104